MTSAVLLGRRACWAVVCYSVRAKISGMSSAGVFMIPNILKEFHIIV